MNTNSKQQHINKKELLKAARKKIADLFTTDEKS